MPSCCVQNCLSNTKNSQLKFFKIPCVDKRSEKCEEFSKRRQLGWLAAIRQNDYNRCKNFRVCELHFVGGSKANLLDDTNINWIPTQNLFVDESLDYGIPEFESEDLNIYDGVADLFDNNVYDDDVPVIDAESIDAAHRTIASQTDVVVTGVSKNLILSYESKIQLLEDELSGHTIKIESFEGNDPKTCFFTGLSNFETMKELFLLLEDFLPDVWKLNEFQKPLLTKFQVFFLVLSRMRLNLSFRYLAYKLNVSPQTISKYFHEGLFVMYSKLRSLVYFPSRNDIKKTMPLAFKERFGEKITVIIDCWENYIQRSSLPKAQAQTWSNYKHHHTLKHLIGITPQGMICFISEGYGGIASDKFVTETCGFLQTLEEGDVVMADRGFLIEDSLKTLGVRAEIPAFTKGQSQLHPYDLEKTRKIANLRIQVEQVIGLLRTKYSIFSQRKFPIRAVAKQTNKCNVSVVDQMLLVCAALINLCGPICVKERES